jgi:hypothetical protein
MTRTTATNFTGVNQFPKADAATDLFKKEDVQVLALAVDAHDHTAGKGLPMTAGAIPNGTITSAMIADLGVATGDLADGAVTSAKIADGTIATVDLANNAVTNAKLGTDTDRTNLLTNGGFEIWQRGNGPFMTAFGPDRWQIAPAGTDTLSVSKNTAQQDGVASLACAACTFTLGTGAGVSNVGQRLPLTEFALTGTTLSASIRVRASVANAVRVAIYNGSAYTYSSYHSGGGAYETLTVSGVSGVAGASAWLQIYFAASCTAYVDNAMLVVGSVAADYAPLHPADDLARCLRYYEVIGGVQQMGIGQAASATGAYVPFFFKANKAVVPTCTFTAAGNYIVTNSGAGALTCTALVASSQAAGSFQIVVTVASGLVAGNACFMQSGAGGTLSIEANP